MESELQSSEVLEDIASHRHAMSLSMTQVVEELVDILGLTTVAAIGGVNETRAVVQWMNGREPQRAHGLRFALQLARMIAAYEDRSLARAWFQGSNPSLGDRIPAMVLRNEPLGDVQGQLMAAARAFAQR